VATVPNIRILLADMPAMLLDIVAGILAAEPDLTVVDMLADSTDLKAAAQRTQADIVVTQQISSVQEAGQLALLLPERQLKIIALTDNGRHGVLYELRPHRAPLGDMSADRLVAAIRAAARGQT
jgi:DNA-binding NarL/FixJ family response regulator